MDLDACLILALCCTAEDVLSDESDDEAGSQQPPTQKGEPDLAPQTINLEQITNGAAAPKEADSSADRLSESATAKSR